MVILENIIIALLLLLIFASVYCDFRYGRTEAMPRWTGVTGGAILGLTIILGVVYLVWKVISLVSGSF